MSPIRQRIALCALLFVVACLPYLGTIPYPFQFDDRTNIVENSAIKDLSSGAAGVRKLLTGQPPSARNRPVTNLTFSLNYLAGGLDPSGYRAVNIILHGINAVLVFLLLTGLTTAGIVPGFQPARAAAAAALWSLSPLHTEAVTYIVQRATSLSACFFLLAAVIFIHRRFRDEGKLPAAAWLLLGFLFLLSALSKENGVLLAPALAVLAWLGNGQRENRPERTTLVLLAVGTVILAAGFFLLVPGGTLDYHIGDGAGYGPWQRLLTQPRVLLWYVSLLLFPLPSRLSIDIQFPASSGLLSPPVTVIAILILAGTAFLAVRSRRRWPLLSLAVLWFLVTSSMESSWLPLEMAFIHRAYLPSIFLFALAVQAAASNKNRASRITGVAVLMGVMILSAAFTVQRNMVYASHRTLWADAAAKAPGKARPLYNLGRSLQEEGRYEKAAGYYRRALKIRPRYALPIAGLAHLAEVGGEPERALELYGQADKLRPGDGEILYNLGRLSYGKGQRAQAARYLERSLATNTLTTRGDAWWYLALISEETGDTEGARRSWSEAVTEYGPGSQRGREAAARLERLP